ncbi:MAG: D-alanine--D-alanine ligase family protein [Brevinemataceae bacterium]
MSKLKIAVLAGGRSAEKEISKRSGLNIHKALLNSGFHAEIIDPGSISWNINSLKEFDVVYPILHGTYGEDGTIQGILEYLGVPYVGSNVKASAVTMDKNITKDIFNAISINCPKGILLKKDCPDNLKKLSTIGYPVFIKPVSEGSSVGSFILHNEQEAQELLKDNLNKFDQMLAEQLITGSEMTMGIFQQKKSLHILPILELRPKAEFYNFETKYTAGMTEFILPAQIETHTLSQIHQDAVKIFEYFGLNDCARIDFFLTATGPCYLEINTAPGMTETSDIPAMLKHENISIEEFVSMMIENALERNNEQFSPKI